MIAGRVKTKQEVEEWLRSEGWVPTDLTTSTGRVWRSTRTGKHIQVPEDDEGLYTDWMLRDLMKEMSIDTRGIVDRGFGAGMH